MLEVKSLSFSYHPGKKVLEGVHFTLSPGELLVIQAPSGYGKSTLAKLLAGYLRPDKGEILLDGKNILDYRGYLPVQMAFQHPEQSVNPKWRVRKILQEGWEVSEEVMEKLGIQPYWLEKFPQELSGGELQRICLARILSPQTRYLLLDEITTMVDALTQVQLFEVLEHFRREHQLGMLLISHNQALIDHLPARTLDLCAF